MIRTRRRERFLEAESECNELLDGVEAGEEVAIVRGGKTIARLIPSEVSFDREKARRAAEALQAMSVGARLDGLDIRDLIAEGRL